ncbi:MAG: putative 2-aminoethylphosphonate ABC transporter permease subunit, partial [Rhodospirillales bacterium]
MRDAAVAEAPRIKPKVSSEDWIMRAVLVGIALYLTVSILLPLYAILSKSFKNADGLFVGLANYVNFFSTPALFWSIENSLTVTLICCVIVVTLAFLYAYALTRTCIPFKALFKGVALLPILMPSLLPAIALVYLFGNQGIIKDWLFGYEIYGPIGIVMG